MIAPRTHCRRAPAAMILFAAVLALFSGLSASRADTPEACDPAAPETIQVTVEKVRSSKGLITAVLYNDNPETFLKEGARLDRIRVEAQAGETTLCLTAPAAGRFSVALYHDENGNKKFDRDFLGIPSEGYGFSQNPGFRFGKPDVEETLFTLDGEPVSLKIGMLYLH
ncbi:MAG: DUF2141 domain-containing protein [Bacteroidota bacterium]|nr:DUF2141 domain-containing protein [Kiloniellaceae bacterium]